MLSCKPTDWDDFFVALNETEIPDDFLMDRERFADDAADDGAPCHES